MARVGILGGTFNPPHLGHLALARRAADELGLATVHLIPAHTAPHKADEPEPGAGHRVQMCRLLVEEDEPALSVWTLEIERGGTSFTVDTLRAIDAAHPDTELTLIVGADSARTMSGWREPMALFELADVAVAARPGTDQAAVTQTLAPLLGGARLQFLRAPMLDISSSQARDRAARGEDVEELVGPRVARYIAEHRLYREPGPAR
jgi:nicotinate-nucleotide adenylyltransferase